MIPRTDISKKPKPPLYAQLLDKKICPKPSQLSVF